VSPTRARSRIPCSPAPVRCCRSGRARRAVPHGPSPQRTAGITGSPDSLSADLIVEGTLTDDASTAAFIAIARDLRAAMAG
jgi:hypothetical protein